MQASGSARGCAWLLIALASGPAHAAGAHVHGVANLQVGVEGNRLALDLTGPLEDFVGFEHAPRDEKQHAAVRRMAEGLQKELLFVPAAAAQCTRTAASHEIRSIDKRHAELVARIEFRCERPGSLSGLEVNLFDTYAHVKRVDVQVAGTKKQTGARLTARNRRVSW
jgi:hypothetical protein